MPYLPSQVDFEDFQARVAQARRSDPVQAVRAANHLLDGALRIRRGGDGIYGEVARPVTKPAEAVSVWLKSLERDAVGGSEFTRSAELREAVIAAAEEVDRATVATPAAARLRGALYSDALDVLGGGDSPRALAPITMPWLIAGVLGGAFFGCFIALLVMRRR